VEGKVVRSVFVGTKKRRTASVPIYKVAMEFSNLPEIKINILRQIIESLHT
jgi:hypothetical protein